MKIKLSRSEMEALKCMVTDLYNQWPCDSFGERLIKVMLNRLAIDLNNRFTITQKEYKLNWHPERSLAFAFAFQQCPLKAGTQGENLRMRLIHAIDQETQNIFTNSIPRLT